MALLLGFKGFLISGSFDFPIRPFNFEAGNQFQIVSAIVESLSVFYQTHIVRFLDFWLIIYGLFILDICVGDASWSLNYSVAPSECGRSGMASST